jgi:hypothetical protein
MKTNGHLVHVVLESSRHPFSHRKGLVVVRLERHVDKCRKRKADRILGEGQVGAHESATAAPAWIM